ncbi:flagellar protein FlgN [Ferrimonas sediminicola]|uniref:Flagellar protein FlgN n=1 Tax=Ferrimonas sediminicola TaxID=2569538 RepID=A0A4U1B9P8_9GAMM|nr:flagellar protein FlgN [Ferrimonas sediminicola]TKB47267.1 flagellar protein FlgN [Ferrimonas sediminicola]
MSNGALSPLIDAQLGRLQALQDLLEQETQALLERDAETIESLLKQKLRALEELNQADQALANHPELTTLKADEAAMAGVDRCRQRLTLCKERNQHNSQLAEQYLASLGRLQQILNATRNPNAMTYNQEGTTTTGGRLGKAIKA